MSKNKLVTIPIEAEKRQRLNDYCAANGSTVAQTLTKYIDMLLEGSINLPRHIEPSISSIDIDAIVDKVIERLKLGTTSIDSLVDVKPNVEQHDIQQPIEQPIEHKPFTLEDTKRVIQSKMDQRRSTTNRSDKISLEQIAVELNTYKYPHPRNKKWDRNEVSRVAKQLGILTT
jgi:hypothetical protein